MLRSISWKCSFISLGKIRLVLGTFLWGIICCRKPFEIHIIGILRYTSGMCGAAFFSTGRGGAGQGKKSAGRGEKAHKSTYSQSFTKLR